MPKSIVRPEINDAANAYHAQVAPAMAYLASRFGPHAAAIAKAANLGYVATPEPGHEAYKGRLAIPYMTTTGALAIKFRCIADHTCDKHAKYLNLTGGRTHLFDAKQTLTDLPYVAITEGELDALTATHLLGIPAVGVAGANAWQADTYGAAYVHLFENIPLVYVIGDGDPAGREFVTAMCALIPNARPIHCAEGEDLNSTVNAIGIPATLEYLGLPTNPIEIAA